MNSSSSVFPDTHILLKKGMFLLVCLALASIVSCSPEKKNSTSSSKQETAKATITYTLEIVPKQQDGKTILPTREEAQELTDSLNNRLSEWKLDDTATLQANGTITLTLVDEDDPEYLEAVKSDLVSCRQVKLLPVHANNAVLVDSGTTSVPGYKLQDFTFTDDEEKTHTEKLFLSKQAVCTSDDIKTAAADETRPGILNITLTAAGSEKMQTATSAIAHGKDRLAIVIDGKVISAPVVQSPLSCYFQISGLNQENETEFMATMLNYPLKWKIRFLEEKAKEAPPAK